MRETNKLSSSDCLSSALVSGLASVLDVDPLSVPVLQEHVDLDALETLVDTDRPDDNPVTVAFRVEDCGVRVSSDGVLTVTDEPGSLGPVTQTQTAATTSAFEESTTQSEVGSL